MRQFKLQCLLGLCFSLFQLLPAISLAQSAYAFNAAKAPLDRNKHEIDFHAVQNKEQQTLFSVLKNLNKEKGVYFLFSEDRLGYTVVNPVSVFQSSIEKILDEILANTGLKYKKISDNTFVIITSREKFKALTNLKVINFDMEPSAALKSETGTPSNFDPLKGKITSSEGMALSGVSVTVKGTTKGTVTNANGEFSIDAKKGDVLVLSSVGFELQEIAVTDASDIVASMVLSNQQLSEVTVTALGIKREKKALGYSIQEVGGKNLVEARENNLVNSLSGRVAGLQLYKTGNGPTGSTRIVIRGNNSLGGNNEPLIVVDGVPMDNFQTANGQSEYGSFDGGNGISDINPDDIETVSVLKGPAAAALYGTRGGNGVILVTTKKGVARKGLGIKINSNYATDKPLLYPELQNEYGQGENGLYNVKSQSSWGPKITGQTITDWRGQSVPMTIDKNDLKNFLQTGQTWTNSIDLSGGSDKTNFRLGYTNLDNKGLLPTSTLKRNLVTLRVSSEVNTKLSVDAKISYTKQNTFNRPQTSGSPSNVFAQYITLPRSVHLADMNPWKDVYGHQILWIPEAYSTVTNPYWVLHENFNDDESDRFLTMVSLDYKFTSWLKLKLRHGMDMRQAFNESATAYGVYNNQPDNPTYNFGSGYGASRSKSIESNADFLVSANKKISDFGIGLSVGGNRLKSTYNNAGGNTGILDLPGVYTLSAGINPRPYSSKYETRLNSLYGFLNLSFKDYLFVDVTYRNDWSSTLAPQNRSFHYPSFSGSLIVSDLLEKSFHARLPSVISFFKLRGAYAQAGNTIGAYSLFPSYGISRGVFDAIITSPPSTLVNPDILPEIVKSQEYGFDLRFFKNRFGIDFTYYKKNAFNQILYLPVPPATGYTTKIVNAGNVQNEGYEFTINAGILQSKAGLNWDMTINYNANKNKVIELDPRQKTYALQGPVNSRAIEIYANEGEAYGDIYGRDFKRNDNGTILVDDDGVPLIQDKKETLIGNYQPKYTMGISNSLSFKGITFGFLIDIRQGGQFYSQSQAYMYGAGTAKGTLANRETTFVFEGVRESDGAKNTNAINAQQYWGRVGGAQPVAPAFLYDASNTRLREVTLGYVLPAKLLGKLPVRNVAFSLVGRNLWMIKSSIPGIDPESSFSTTNAQGWENGAYPSTRTIGANLKFEF